MKETTSIKDVDLGWRKIKENLLYFGITETQVGHWDDQFHEESGMNMAKLASKQELGFPTQGLNSPPRPFHEHTANRYENEVVNDMSQAVSKMYTGKYTVHELMVTLGEEYEDYMREGMHNFSNPGNAPSTIKRKGEDNPLIDSGELADGVTYKVVDRRRGE